MRVLLISTANIQNNVRIIFYPPTFSCHYTPSNVKNDKKRKNFDFLFFDALRPAALEAIFARNTSILNNYGQA